MTATPPVPLPRPRRPVAARILVASLASLAAAVLARPVAAQGSPYVPLDDPAYVYVDALVARDRLPGLGQLERPYTAAQLARALDADAAAGRPAAGVVQGWLARLRERLAWHAPAAPRPARGAGEPPPRPGAGDGGLAVAATIGVRGTIESTTRRALLLADRDDGVHPGAHLRVAAVAGPVVAAGRYVLDQRWRNDPDYGGITDAGVAGRAEEAYVAGQWRYGELLAGRLGRSWGPPGLAGLQIGDDADSWDHVHGRLGTDRLRLAAIVARLDDTPGLHDPRVQRYLVAHRLAGRLGPLELAASETYVYSGPGRGFEPSLANPLAPVALTHYNEDHEGNLNVAVDALWRSPWGVFAVQAMLDDYQFERGGPATDEPPSYGLTTTAEGLPLWGAHRWFASYTRLANLTYRSGNVGDNYVWRGVALGRGHVDHDEVRVGADLALLAWAPVRAYVARRRQGEGDYRLPFPAIEEYAATPAFLSGRVATITRAALATGGAAGGVAWRADVGYNRVSGAGVPVGGARGATPLAGSGLAGRLTVRVEPGLLRWRDRGH